MYSIKCSTCNQLYIGQRGRDIYARFKEHVRYICTNNPKLAFAVHILKNNHQYDIMEESLWLITPCNKGNRLNLLENLHIQQFHSIGLLMDEQCTFEYNTLFSQFKTRAPLYTHDSASWHNHTTPADFRNWFSDTCNTAGQTRTQTGTQYRYVSKPNNYLSSLRHFSKYSRRVSTLLIFFSEYITFAIHFFTWL
jgi:hypothetical protein